MKDLEKIKSEDLGCQVQDANPGNFAIEQEVAQLVGATVPAPTEPSADDARELGAQLLVFLRRALLPIRSALRTALAAIYAHLDSRCTDYTPAAYTSYIPRPYDPMGTPPTPRILPNLLTAITAFASRKISNGSATNDGIPDGVSLARLLCADYADVVELKDDTHGWTYSRNSLAQFPNAKKVTLGCKTATVNIVSNNSVIEELNIEELETVPTANGSNLFNALTKLKHFRAPKLKQLSSGQSTNLSGLTECEDIDMPEMTSMWNGYGAYYMCNNPALKWVNIPKFDTTQNVTGQAILCNNPELERVKMGKLIQFSMRSNLGNEVFYNCPKLVDVEIGADTAISLYLAAWNPTDKGTTFLQNFKEHIALRLTSNGSGKTLTLSQAVFDTIWNQDGTPKSTDPDSVIYQINKIIKTDKHWSVNRA